MSPPEQNEIQKEQRAAEYRKACAAFQKLKESEDFGVAWEFLQRRFPINRGSFVAGHEGNTHLAAIRDGEKNVIREILKMLSLPSAVEIEDGDSPARPTQAVSDLGTPPTP